MRFGRISTLALVATALGLLCMPQAARGVMIGLEGISFNNDDAIAVGEQQLWIDVTQPQANQAAFTFYNTGSAPSVITGIYFEEGPLAALLTITSSEGVSFAEGGNPKSLPSGNNLPDPFETAFRVTTPNQPAYNGVNNSVTSSEWVRVVFTLESGKTFADVLSQIHSKQLRVGMHVQGFDDGYSEAFINTTPEPTTLVLGAVGLLASGMIRRRQPAVQD